MVVGHTKKKGWIAVPGACKGSSELRLACLPQPHTLPASPPSSPSPWPGRRCPRSPPATALGSPATPGPGGTAAHSRAQTGCCAEVWLWVGGRWWCVAVAVVVGGWVVSQAPSWAAGRAQGGQGHPNFRIPSARPMVPLLMAGPCPQPMHSHLRPMHFHTCSIRCITMGEKSIPTTFSMTSSSGRSASTTARCSSISTFLASLASGSPLLAPLKPWGGRGPAGQQHSLMHRHCCA